MTGVQTCALPICSRMVKWGQITVTKDNATGKITKIVAKGEDFGEGEKVIYTAPAEG